MGVAAPGSLNKEFRFYSRSSDGEYILEVEELRNLFNLSATTAERIRDFRAGRLSQIIADETPVKLDNPPRFVLHIIPLSAFDTGSRFDVSSVARNINDLLPVGGGGYNPRYNLDGYLTHSQNGGVSYAYLQVFRNGVIESVRATYDSGGRGPRLNPNKQLESDVLEALPRFLRIQEQLGVEPPLVLTLSALNVSGYALTTDTLQGLGGQFIDRDVLDLPDVLVEHYDSEPAEVMRDVFNSLWNAAGYEYCKNYADRGRGKRVGR